MHRSSSGTRCARAALRSGAEPLYVASLVVAGATAAAVARFPRVTVVASGLGGTERATEDEICAGFLTRLMSGLEPDPIPVGAAAASCDRAQLLREVDFTHPDDVDLCCDVDRFDFAMAAQPEDGLLRVRREFVSN